jgi:hypothetical protein
MQELVGALHGTESGGFRVVQPAGGRTLVLECWGYWEDDVLATFAWVAGGALEKAGSPLELTLDAAMLKPQSSKGQDALVAFLRRVAMKAPEQVSVRVDNVLTQMQLTRLMRQSGLGSVRFSNLSGRL